MLIERFLSRLFQLPRPQKRIIQVAADVLLLASSYVLAIFLRIENLSFAEDARVWLILGITIPISIFIFVRIGFYRAVVRYIGSLAVGTIIGGVGASAGLVMILNQAIGRPFSVSVAIIYALLAFASVGGIRFALRALHHRQQWKKRTPVLIYGAGAAGRRLLDELRAGVDYAPVAFIDDSPELNGVFMSGLRIHSPRALKRLIKSHGVEAVLLAVPSARAAERARIIARLEPLPVHVQTVPVMDDIVAGRAKLHEIKDVAIEDLLGRDPVPPRDDLMGANIRDKVVMVTGAGGSIGCELCAHIIRQRPKALLMFDISEYALYLADQTISAITQREGINVDVVRLLGSVQNRRRVETVLRRHGVETIYHAAAYKHVPLVEHNVAEGVRNNVFGTRTLAEAAVAAGVDAFILVSSDKAVRPANVMGATKRLAELICQALASTGPTTRFSLVRFGNVLGSSGSVIPLFRQQIRQGGPVTVTHPEIERYFMTIPEAAALVIQAGAMGTGGDVFVLDMGESVRIADLAVRMIRLSGLEPVVVPPGGAATNLPRGDIRVEFTRLRDGEKLYEELLIDRAATRRTEHPKIMTAAENFVPWDALQVILADLMEACTDHDADRIRKILVTAPIDFDPNVQTVRPRRVAEKKTAEKYSAIPRRGHYVAPAAE